MPSAREISEAIGRHVAVTARKFQGRVLYKRYMSQNSAGGESFVVGVTAVAG